ncbi:hypothetical protein SeLEV6574_g06971 [Synchytrium endobioticum]|uniref:Secreted protein n=1 Tax=Synchytrium endobioticum TaxID=286115 RepID=A0A507CMI8_9FUNG|nr:hypothetical protein SeLEV6574_g06971 [Synchytrium endobioticum]
MMSSTVIIVCVGISCTTTSRSVLCIQYRDTAFVKWDIRIPQCCSWFCSWVFSWICRCNANAMANRLTPPHDLVQLPVATEYCCWEHGNHGGMWLPDEVCMIPNNHTVFAACCRNSIKTIFPVGYSIIDTEAQCGGSLHP